MASKSVNYKNIKIDDIIAWCKENKKVDWLKETAAKQVPCKVFPKKTIEVDGKKKTVADKSATPTTELRPITFIQIKRAFFEEFFPEMIPVAKDKKPSMYDKISAL
jgi:hypothetical protein